MRCPLANNQNSDTHPPFAPSPLHLSQMKPTPLFLKIFIFQNLLAHVAQKLKRGNPKIDPRTISLAWHLHQLQQDHTTRLRLLPLPFHFIHQPRTLPSEEQGHQLRACPPGAHLGTSADVSHRLSVPSPSTHILCVCINTARVWSLPQL